MTFQDTNSAGKWQRRFLKELFKAVVALRGGVNFTNLARFSPLGEQTFRRNFKKSFDWFRFNWVLICLIFTGEKYAFIVAIDCTFLPKTGSETYGLDRFWSGTPSRTKRELEASAGALIHRGSGRAFTLAAAQTPPDLATGDQPDPSTPSRMSFYMRQLSGYLRRLPDRIRYGVAEGYYAKSRVFDTTTEAGCHLISKLRRDANLRYLYDGPQTSRRGAPKLYDGKVDSRISRASSRSAASRMPPTLRFTPSNSIARTSGVTCEWS